MSDLNQQLQDLYAGKWNDLSQAFQKVSEVRKEQIQPASPLLLKVDDDAKYHSADIRLMIFGQETNSWYEPFHADMSAAIGYYDEFYNQAECWNYGGHFWNGIKRFLELLQNHFPDKKIYLMWNNIVKIGKHDDMNFPPEYIHEIERKYFSIIPQELEILKPDVALFLTGPNYDSVINNVFDNPDFTPISDEFSTNQIAKLDVPNITKSFRTYHPGYLWRNNINAYFETIIEKI